MAGAEERQGVSLLAGKYEIIRLMAVGGVAEIYLARTKSRKGRGRLIVVKRLLPALAREPELSRMLLAEATIASVLEHPNIVQVLDLGSVETAEGRDYFIVMEFIHGRDFSEVLDRLRIAKRRLPLALVCDIAQTIAAGLAYAHSACDYQGRSLGIVHRDLSPHNVLVGFDGGVKISDFGIAKFATDDVSTDAGVFKGKFRYMSPEQASRQEVDHRSDIFSIGTILWEMLAGEPLFGGRNLLETVELVRRAKIPDLRETRPEIPTLLWEVCAVALARKPAARFQAASEFADAFGAARASLPAAPRALTLVRLMAELYDERERVLPEAGAGGLPSEAPPAEAPRRTSRTTTGAILGRLQKRAKSDPDRTFADIVVQELTKIWASPKTTNENQKR